MLKVFADLVYWVALINPADQWFQPVHNVADLIRNRHIVTTNEVLVESLNFYAEKGEDKRDAISSLIRSILLDFQIETIVSSEVGFLDGLILYESRRDKGYSLTDCISMNVCRERKIMDILTHDDPL